MTKRKPTPTRQVPVRGETTPKFLIGERVFYFSWNGINEGEITAILLAKDGFHYFLGNYERVDDITPYGLEPEQRLFINREELKASL